MTERKMGREYTPKAAGNASRGPSPLLDDFLRPVGRLDRFRLGVLVAGALAGVLMVITEFTTI